MTCSASPGEPSEQSTWETVAAAAPRVVVAMPCGYDAERAHAEAAPTPTRCAALGAERVVAVDASAYFSRPGPRLVDGLELLAHILHPDLVPEPVGGGPRGRALSRAPSRSAGGAASAPATAIATARRSREDSRSARPAHAVGALERHAASTPPIRPPTCPPTEMPASRTRARG